MAIIRYPGSKSKLATAIMRHFPDSQTLPLWSNAEQIEYREPFFGSGEMGLRIMRGVLDTRCRVWINDIDPGIAALWHSVKDHPGNLCRAVQDFTPHVDHFYSFKQSDGTTSGDVVNDGFRKLALHRMSVSGFGYKSGGPIGGRHQNTSDYRVDCRWSASRIKRDIGTMHRAMKRFHELRITCGDFRPMIHGATAKTFIYLDPPYYEKGEQLYKHNMAPRDHAELADMLRACAAHWVLSYDDHAEIRRMYAWANIHEIEVTYSNAVCKSPTRPKNREIVITPPVTPAHR